MKNVFVVLLLFVVTSYKASGKDYLAYHHAINLAEYYIVHNHADSVFYYYDKTFGAYDFIFAKDALIAAQFAWKQNQPEKTTRYLMKGAENGLKSKCLDLCPILQSYTEQRSYLQVHDSMAAANRRFNASLDKALREEWMTRFDEQYLGYDEVSDFIGAIQKNTARVKQMTSDGKFPGEKYIGLADDCNILGSIHVFYALANYDCIVTEMHDALWTAVKNGELHPREFAAIWEWEYVRSAKKMDVQSPKTRRAVAYKYARVYLKDNVYVETNRNCKNVKQRFRHFNILLNLSDVPIEELDKNRNEYYITSIELDKQKEELEAKERYRIFFGNK